MVGHSEPAFRMLVRQHGVGMCSTEMIDSGGYVRSESYRRQFEFPLGDRPLIVQLVGVNRPTPRSSRAVAWNMTASTAFRT